VKNSLARTHYVYHHRIFDRKMVRLSFDLSISAYRSYLTAQYRWNLHLKYQIQLTWKIGYFESVYFSI
jgi:hypothetical protein